MISVLKSHIKSEVESSKYILPSAVLTKRIDKVRKCSSSAGIKSFSVCTVVYCIMYWSVLDGVYHTICMHVLEFCTNILRFITITNVLDVILASVRHFKANCGLASWFNVLPV